MQSGLASNIKEIGKDAPHHQESGQDHGVAGLAAAALVASATVANAGVTIDLDGNGFVRKRDVQMVSGTP
jgi:hypothetical protein